MELKMDIGKTGTLKTKYEYTIKIGRAQKGYFIVINDRKIGPFSNLIMSITNHEQIIIANSDIGSKIYRAEKEGIKLIDKVIPPLITEKTLNNYLKNLEEKENKERFDNCELLGKVSDHLIYLSNKKQYFAVNTLEPFKPFNEYPKFSNYDDLTLYYREKNIKLFSSEIVRTINKSKRIFINFNDILNYINNLTVEDLDFETQIRIINGKNLFKEFFNEVKEKGIKVTNNDEDAEKFLKDNYIEIKYTSFDKLNQLLKDEMDNLEKAMNSKTEKLKDECILYLRKKDNIDFNLLCETINTLTIKDLDDKVRREVGGKRPLSPSMFIGFFNSALAKDGNLDLSKMYISMSKFKAVYANEYEKLFNIINAKLPSLQEEYLKLLQEKFNQIRRG